MDLKDTDLKEVFSFMSPLASSGQVEVRRLVNSPCLCHSPVDRKIT